MMGKVRNFSLQFKISSIYIVTNLLVVMVNIFLIIGINSMSGRLDMVYQDNRHLNDFSDIINALQDDMTDYLNVKTSDSLENYYRSEQLCRNMAADLNEEVTGRSFDRMERNIRHMTERYLEEVAKTIESKRGRNVEKYRLHYENATRMYGYIDTYLSNLNMEQFRSNSERYSELQQRFRLFEAVSVIAIILVMISNVCIIISFVGALIRPLKKLSSQADEVAKGNFEIDLLPVESQDEVGVVTGAFNSMVVSIGRYIERIRESMEAERALKERELLMEGHLKDARLKYLQAQINPHFLFNTLNAGAQLAMMEGADKTTEFIENMADFPGQGYKRSYCAQVEELCELVDTLGNQYSNVGVCWDFGHANLVYGDQVPCLRYLSHRLKVTHVHDNRGEFDEHRPPYLGNVNWEAIMPTLKEIGYQGDFSFEVIRMGPHVPEYLRDSLWVHLRKVGEYLISLAG